MFKEYLVHGSHDRFRSSTKSYSLCNIENKYASLFTVCTIDFLCLYLFWTEKKCFLIKMSLNTNHLNVHRHNIEPMKFIGLAFVCSSVVICVCYFKKYISQLKLRPVLELQQRKKSIQFCVFVFYNKKELHNISHC